MCSDSEKNMSAFADQNHAPSLTCVRLECCGMSGQSFCLKLAENLLCYKWDDRICILFFPDEAGIIGIFDIADWQCLKIKSAPLKSPFGKNGYSLVDGNLKK